MVTGASTANVALVLVDARNGVSEQTRRHAIIASLLQIPHLVVCINKMDLVDYSEDIYNQIQDDFESFAAKLDVKDVHFIPISALKGDNVVHRSEMTKWYEGTTLMHFLENVHIASDHNFIDARFPVQTVIRPYNDEFHDYRGYAGRVSGGSFKIGDEVVALPSGFSSKIKRIVGPSGDMEEAFPPQSVTLLLEDDIDISRGDMIVRENNQPNVGQDLDLMVCWFDNHKTLLPRGKYVLKHTTQDVRCIVKEIRYKMNINTLHRDLDDKNIKMNDISRISIRTTKPLFTDSYRKNRITGSVIIIDEGTNRTVGAGMVI
jgi:sulfate adenylyltransferase subunit 1